MAGFDPESFAFCRLLNPRFFRDEQLMWCAGLSALIRAEAGTGIPRYNSIERQSGPA
jgi:hypothetical protein